MRKLILSSVLLATLPMIGRAATYDATLINTAVSYSTTPTVNLNAFGTPQSSARNLASQVTWSSQTLTNGTFTDGSQSTGSILVVNANSLWIPKPSSDTITVPSTALILGAPATGQITVVSTTGLAGLTASFTTVLQNYSGIALSSPSINLNQQEIYTWADNWASTDTIAHAATTLANAINTSSVFSASVVSSTGVAISYRSSGTFANGFKVYSSSNTDISTGSFSGGANPVAITLNNGVQNLVFTYGSNWTSSDTVNHAATTLASAINGSGGILATAASAVVYASATNVGTYANSYTMATSSSSRVSVSSTNFSGGLDRTLLNAYFTLNGVRYTNGKHWTDVSNTSTGTCASIATFLNSFGTYISTCTGSVVYTTTTANGTANNGITLTASSGSNLTIGSPTFTGGQDAAQITINQTTLTTQVDFSTGSSTTNTATNIKNAINANATLAAQVTATSSLNNIALVSVNVGADKNYPLSQNAASGAMTLSSSTLLFGTNSGYNITTDTISITNHGFNLGLPVLYSTGTVAIGGLTNQTTYYVIPVDANTLYLSATSTGALAGAFINLTSSTTGTTAHTYTLAPLSFSSGTAGGFWQVSNDGTNWATFSTTAGGITVSSQAFTANGTQTNVQDYGSVNYNYMRYNITGPSQGGLNVKVLLNSKD